MRVDVLVFGPHPDDIEIGLGGSVARHVDLGYRVGLCDLTRGELSTNGTVKERFEEAQAAAEVLGVEWRENLGWPDGEIGRDGDHVRSAVELLRRCQPTVVAVPYWGDRHPDHEVASRVLTAAVFRSGLRRYAAEGSAWKPDWVCYYFINDTAEPSFILDVSGSYPRKREALECHRSQFRPVSHDAVPTRLTSSRFLQMIEARDAHLGALAGVAHAEGVVVKEPVVRSTLFKMPASAGGVHDKDRVS